MKYLMIIFAIAATACQAQDHTKHQQGYQSPGKPSYEVSMDYKLSSERVAVGETVDVTLNFDNSNKGISAKVATTDNMSFNGKKEAHFLAQKSGQANASHTFSVTPLTEGIHYINIFAKEASMSHEKPFAIRIIAGDKPVQEYLQKNGRVAVDENGEKIIIMQAEEQ